MAVQHAFEMLEAEFVQRLLQDIPDAVLATTLDDTISCGIRPQRAFLATRVPRRSAAAKAISLSRPNTRRSTGGLRRTP